MLEDLEGGDALDDLDDLDGFLDELEGLGKPMPLDVKPESKKPT